MYLFFHRPKPTRPRTYTTTLLDKLGNIITILISKPADNYLRVAHYLFYLLSLNGRAGQITRETNYLWVTIDELFLFCYERDFMQSLSDDSQFEDIEPFDSTSLYLDDLLNIDNNFYDSMVNHIYPSELKLDKAKFSDTEASFMDLHVSISDGFVKTKIYDKRDGCEFDIVTLPFLDSDGPRSTSYGVYISQLIRFARVPSHVDDLNTRNKVLTAKLLKQGYRYHKLRKALSNFIGGILT